MEIERKFLIKELPKDLERFPHADICQAYLNTEPVLRIRRQADKYSFTYKGEGLLAREEYNLPLNEKSFHHLLAKADGAIIKKTRYNIPLKGTDLSIELDMFTSPKEFAMAEVEFPDIASANAFTPPAWFGEDVTQNPAYHNSNLSKIKE